MISRILAIDPGTVKSGFMLFTDKLEHNDVLSNEELLELVKKDTLVPDMVVCEGFRSYGNAVGESTFETAYYIGRLWQTCLNMSIPWKLVFRPDIKLHFCHTSHAKDTNIRRALLDLFPATGGGATPQVGTKKEPGPLYGVSSHSWSALAIALFARDNMPLFWDKDMHAKMLAERCKRT